MDSLTRRSWLRLAGLGTALGAVVAGGRRLAGQSAADTPIQPMEHSAHLAGPVGRASLDHFNPSTYLRAWNFSDLAPAERARYYKETQRPDGSMLREYQLVAIDREIEIAPGVFFPAWTYNGQVPGPTIRATEGDRVRVTFLNQGTHPHTIHFHGWHPPEMDGSLPEHQVMPGGKFVYEFDAEPSGLHLYHCHAMPLKRHIHKGLYGAFIVDPKGNRAPADEMVMLMNGFDTNFDADNEVYAVNTIASHYMHDPIRVDVGRLVRIYLINVTEFDLINSLHIHGMFFESWRTGTPGSTRETADTIMLCQGERAILETTFRYPGRFMFHAHQSEFAEIGWMGLFEAVGARRDT
jgi:FtsP/CotA-like multicopper oxidase with cupredoxin domain